MKKIYFIFIKNLRGDKYLLSFVTLLAIFSFLPVYSAISNLVFHHNHDDNITLVFYYLFRHAFFLLIGYLILFFTQFINYKYIYKLSVILIPIILILLFFTIKQGVKLNGINAARWLYIPILNISFQTSNIASLSLFIYCARYLSQKKNESIGFLESFFPLLLPIFSIIGMILPSNASTAIIVFISVIILLFIGGYPIINIIGMILMGILFSTIYVSFAIKSNDRHPTHRVFTWKNRIEKFLNGEESYQMIQSKTAIILGNKFGRGPGKSILKTFLPQSYSDFIYSIIIEEYGFFGGIVLIFIYLLILFRIIIIATKLNNYFCTLLVFSLGFPIIIQAIVNMSVAVGIFPITGQTLPLISVGGTSIWINFFSFGIILSVSRMIYEKSKS